MADHNLEVSQLQQYNPAVKTKNKCRKAKKYREQKKKYTKIVKSCKYWNCGSVFISLNSFTLGHLSIVWTDEGFMLFIQLSLSVIINKYCNKIYEE